jgi:large subunit ribosomal protein L21
MYAVIRTGGKQYRVSPGETILVENLKGKLGSDVTFGDVLALQTEEDKLVFGSGVGKARVTAKIVAHDRHPKVLVMKYKTGGQYKITRGHRQGYTAVRVSEIHAG